MKVFSSLEDWQDFNGQNLSSIQEWPPVALTIGNFDGVHLGHQKLMYELLTQSANYKTQSVVCTFRPHPREILRPDVPYYRLFDYRDQAEKLAELGVDFLIEEKFDRTSFYRFMYN